MPVSCEVRAAAISTKGRRPPICRHMQYSAILVAARSQTSHVKTGPHGRRLKLPSFPIPPCMIVAHWWIKLGLVPSAISMAARASGFTLYAKKSFFIQKEKQKSSAAGILTWSPTVILICRFAA
ncbi:hypothetical protein KC324_g90 [Hortaea werneckii]|nr:hypothetical protein KC324_g90 [Hortaea werneckii]